MASGDGIFSATGVTDGSLLDGVHFRGEFAETETVVLRSKTGTVRRIKTTFRMLGTQATLTLSFRPSLLDRFSGTCSEAQRAATVCA